MTVDFEAVEKALNDRLASGSFGLPILWAGVDYPSMPAEFLYTQILRVRGINVTFKTAEFPGEFLVTHKTRGGGGTLRGAEIGTAVADHFNAAGKRITYTGGIINLTTPAAVLGPITGQEWIETPCSIPFRVMG